MGTVMKILALSALLFILIILYSILRASSKYEELEELGRTEIENGEIQEKSN